MDAQSIAFAGFALARNIVYLLIGIVILIGAMELIALYLNRSLGITMKDDAWDIIKADPNAVALYFGLRVLGVLIACGWIASAFLK